VEPTRGPLLSSPIVARAARWGIVAWSYPIRIIFPPLLVALIIVYLTNPLVSRMERRGIPRIWGTLLVYAVFLALVGTAMAYLVPLVSQQVGNFVDSVPALLDRAEQDLRDLGFDIGQDGALFEQLQSNLTGEGGFVGRVVSFTAGVLHVALIMVLGPILAFYLTVDLPKMRRGLQAIIPARRRTEVQAVGERLSAAIGGFFRGQLLVALFVGLASMLVLYVVGLPYWALVGLLTGLFNLIPLIGPFIGGAIAVLIAFTTEQPAAGFLLHPEPGWELAVAASVGLLLVQQVDNHIISPNIVARTVKLHPVTVMLSLLAGGTLLGLWGMLLAVPVVASAKILLLHTWDTRSSWPPGAPTALVAGAEPADRAEPAPAPAADSPPSPVTEGETGRWWIRWRARLPWRKRDLESTDGERAPAEPGTGRMP
jgi:predicted PurR-regulated permease PerM